MFHLMRIVLVVVVSVCLLVDGMPLVIELAAAPAALAVTQRAPPPPGPALPGCSPGEAAPPGSASRRCGRPSSGPISSSTLPAAVAAADAVGVRRELRPGRRRRGMAGSMTSRCSKYLPCWFAGGQEPRRRRACSSTAFCYRAAGDHPPVRRQRPAEALTRSAVAARTAVHFQLVAEAVVVDLTGLDQGSRAGPAARRSGQPAGAPPGTRPAARMGPRWSAPGRHARPLLESPLPGAGGPRAARPGASAARRPRRPRTIRRGPGHRCARR